MSNKDKIITLILLLSLSIILFIQFGRKESTAISGEDIYNALELKNCYRIHIPSYEYIKDGKLKGEENDYVITEKKEINDISIIIKDIDSHAVEVKKYIPGVFETTTHQIYFYIKGSYAVSTKYSVITNELLFIDTEKLEQLTNSSTFNQKVLLVKMDDRFKEVFNELINQ